MCDSFRTVKFCLAFDALLQKRGRCAVARKMERCKHKQYARVGPHMFAAANEREREHLAKIILTKSMCAHGMSRN